MSPIMVHLDLMVARARGISPDSKIITGLYGKDGIHHYNTIILMQCKYFEYFKNIISALKNKMTALLRSSIIETIQEKPVKAQKRR